jgi:hypothetical protein
VASEPLVVDWDQLLPEAIGTELGVSPVVPSTVAAGEISVAASGPRPPPVEPTRVEPAVNEERLRHSASGVVSARPAASPAPAAPAAAEAVIRKPIEEPLLLRKREPLPVAEPPVANASAPDPAPPAPPVLPVQAVVEPPRAASRPAPSRPASEPPPRPDGRAEPAPRPAAAGEPPATRPASRPGRAPSQPPLFSATEEAFFARGAGLSSEPESFDDLDEGLDLPQGFWRRLFRSPHAPLGSSGDKTRRGRRR